LQASGPLRPERRVRSAGDARGRQPESRNRADRDDSYHHGRGQKNESQRRSGNSNQPDAKVI